MQNSLPDKIRRLIYVLIIIAIASLGANGFLAYQWQAEKGALQAVLGVKEQALKKVSTSNKKLTTENRTIRQDLVEKDEEIAAKIAELQTKQKELTELSKQLESKQQEVAAKAKELTTKEKELAEAQKKIDDQKSQIASNSSELSKLRNRPPLFSFNVKSSTVTDVEAKKEAVKQVVSDAYDTIEEVSGKAYLLHSVSINFVEKFSNDKASGEIIITNSDEGLKLEINIKDFDKSDFNDVNTIIHEIVHAFHGLAVLEPSAFEEGYAVAVTDAVMAKMKAAGTIPKFSELYIRISDAEFQSKMDSLSIPRNQDAMYGSDDVADYYQVLGKAWYKLYQQDNNFFSKFNEKLYAKKHDGQEITERLVLDTIKEVLPGASLTGAAWELK